MRYEDIIKTVSEIAENENIYTEGLTLVYELDEDRHMKMDEHLYYKGNPDGIDFKPREIIEVISSGILIKIIRKEE